MKSRLPAITKNRHCVFFLISNQPKLFSFIVLLILTLIFTCSFENFSLTAAFGQTQKNVLNPLSVDQEPIRFNSNFPGAAIGKIEYLGPDRYRCYVDGQYNQYGRNRQPTWFYFRMDGVKGRTIHLTLTNFLGEYNNRPYKNGALGIRDLACGSSDNINWSKITNSRWNTETNELEISVSPESDQYWIAYIPPYVSIDHNRFLAEADRSDRVLIETYGKGLAGSDLKMLTVTDFSIPNKNKKQIWIVARLHAWESYTSMIAEGLVRFLIDPQSKEAANLCRSYLMRIVIMPDPDGCDRGHVRFNNNGFDLNRTWSKIDLGSKEVLRLRPEVWYLKKQIVLTNAIQPVFVVFNLHDHQTGYDLLETNGDGNDYLNWYKKFEEKMEAAPLFLTNPKNRARIITSRIPNPQRTGSMDEIWEELGIPHVLIEYNVNRKGETDYYLTPEDAHKNGVNLMRALDQSFH